MRCQERPLRLLRQRLGAAVAVGSFSAAVLVTNNVRDIPTDRQTGKHTLAVRLGDRGSRRLYLALMIIPFLITIALGVSRPWTLLGLLALALVVRPIRVMAGDATGRTLIPVLRDTGLAMLLWAALSGLALSI